MLSVVTSFGPEGYQQYGKTFIDSFKEHWPRSVKLVCYTEQMQIQSVPCVDLFSIEPCASFLFRHAGNPAVMGKMEDPISPWGQKAKREGYCFKHDAYKFARKVFAVCHAARNLGSGKLFWIDADVVTFNEVDKKFLDDLLPDSVSLAYLPRSGYHSELGFVGYNLDRIETHAFLTAYEWQYSSDAFMVDPHWDDCNQFDYLVKKFTPKVKLIENTSRSQPFEHSVLGRHMTHNKGPRKAA